MTHTQKWLTIAKAFATEPEKRTPHQQTIAHGGLCFAWEQVNKDSPPTDNQLRKLSKLGEYWRGYSLWWWPCSWVDEWSREHDLLRSTFACFMAAMNEKEFNQLLEG